MTLTPEQIAELRRAYEAMRACTQGVGITRDGDFAQAREIDEFERLAYRNFDALLSAAEENARLREALSGVIGLTQLVRARDDISEELREILLSSHRIEYALTTLGEPSHE